ncbi:MAG TPA: hypothetical protein VF062_05235 [Candidatus Limnocylindrales bacterium]
MGNWRTKVFLWIGLPAIAVIGLVFGAQDLVPSYQAQGGKGTAGTFTAQREDCGRRSCSWYGDWQAADGSKTRTDVILYDEPDSLKQGDSVEAVDTGARNGVYTKGGGASTFYLTLALSLAGLAAAIGFVFFLIRQFTRRRQPQSQQQQQPA